MRLPGKSHMPWLLMAFRHWKRGEPIPVDLAMKLTDLGYDFTALERRYLA